MDHISFPRFWSEKPALWFAQVEAVFELNGVQSDNDKYHHIITELNNDTISLLEDVILNPPDEEFDDKYSYLKDETIKRLSIVQLEKEQMGGMKPSEFLQYLQNKADQSVPKESVRSIWYNRLPKHVRDIVTIDSSGNMEVLSEMADKVLQVIPTAGSTASIPSEDISKRLDKISVQIGNLQAQMEKLQVSVYGVHCTPNKTCNTQTVAKIDKDKHLKLHSPSLDYCWYHANFGNRAAKCDSPCAYREKHATQDALNVTSF